MIKPQFKWVSDGSSVETGVAHWTYITTRGKDHPDVKTIFKQKFNSFDEAHGMDCFINDIWKLGNRSGRTSVVRAVSSLLIQFED